MREMWLYGLNATHTRMLLCLEDLTDDEARRSPVAGLSPIIWQAGHVAVTDSMFVRRVDGRTEAPAGFSELFKMGTGGEAAYPALAAVRDAANGAQALVEELAKTAPLDAKVEGRSYSTVAEMLTFCLYHRGYHIGKITTLRALLKKPRLFG